MAKKYFREKGIKFKDVDISRDMAAARDMVRRSGLLLPETAKEKPQIGLVIAAGDDEDIQLKANDKILFAKYSGTEFKMDGQEYLLLEASDVLAKFLN